MSADGEREQGLLNQELCDLENEMLNSCLAIDADLAERFGGSTGGLIITDEHARIVLHERIAR